MKDLKFTIITPSFNQGNFIEETICSIVNQNYKHFEYFVIDGGSEDQTIDIIRKYENRISFWISEKDRGQSHALNKGFQKATGDILIWINSDDILVDGALEKAARYFLDNPSVDVVHGCTILFQDAKQQIREPEEGFPELYLSGMAFSQPSAFMRRLAIQKYYPVLNESLHYGMDYDLFSCLYLNCAFLSVTDVFSKYRLHQHSKTIGANEGFAKDWQKVFCKIIKSIGSFEEIENGLTELNMWNNDETNYPILKSFKKSFITKSFQYFLYFQLKFYYRDLNLLSVKRISGFIKREFPEFYKEKNIGRFHLISMLPFARYLIPLMRKPTF
jgi:glycosyltransferase involved in cell wall biosynthesis